MLQRMIVLPSLFSCVSTTANSDEQAVKDRCRTIIAVLRQAAQDSCLVVPRCLAPAATLESYVEDWPKNERTLLLKLLQFFRNRNRIAEIQVDGDCGGCSSGPCEAVAFLREWHLHPEWGRPNYVLGSDACCSIAKRDGPPFQFRSHERLLQLLSGNRGFEHIKAVELRKTSGFDGSMAILVRNNECPATVFDRDVLGPLFTDAKHVKIFDRQIGRVTNRTQRQKQVPIVAKSYSDGLTWLIDSFVQKTRQSCRSVQIWTGILAVNSNGDIDLSECSEVAKALHNFSAKLAASYPNLQCEVHLFLEGADGSALPHGRFIATDQACLFVDRGFDLLNSAAKIRDTVLTLISAEDAASLETTCSTLPRVEWNPLRSTALITVNGKSEPLGSVDSIKHLITPALGRRPGTRILT